MSRRAMAAVLVVLALGTSACSVHRLDEGDDVAAGSSPDALTGSTLVAPGETADGTVVGAPGADPASPGSGPSGNGGPAAGGQAAQPGRAPTGNSTSNEARTASDRGVTASEITLGILHTADTFFAASGGSTKSVDKVIAPFIAEINAAGGINGRKVVPKISTYDPLSVDSMNAACVQQAEDHKVFASIAQIGFYGDAEVCMATKQVPLLTNNNSTTKTNVQRERGWVRQTNQNKDRNIKNWIDWMVASGLLNASTKTGLIFVDVPEDRDLVNEVMLPYLKAKGLQAPEMATLSSSIAQTPAEAQAAVLRFNSAGVKLVLPLVSFLRVLIFAQQADAARYVPKYSVSDFGLLSTDAMAGMPPSQWAGVRAITVLPTGIGPSGGLPTTAAFTECYAAYKKFGQDFAIAEGKPEGIEVANMLHYCEHLALWADAARRAGVNPTRKSLLAAYDNTGTWTHRVGLSERLTFSPTKFDGADLYAVVEWKPNCTSDGGCYRQVEGFRPGRW